MKFSLSLLLSFFLVLSVFSSLAASLNVTDADLKRPRFQSLRPKKGGRHGKQVVKHNASSRPRSWSFPNFNGYTDQSFLKAWHTVNDAYGKENRAIVNDPDPSHSKDKVLRILYPAGSYNPSGNVVGGTGIYAIPLPIPKGSPVVTFSYEVYFPKGFDWVKGGKLPGLYAGHSHCSGGNNAKTCFSTRFMWRQSGVGELYAYLPKNPQVSDICSLHQGKGEDVCNNDFGFSLDRGAFRFQPGQWHTIKQTMTPNAKGRAETGKIEVWYDGALLMHFADLDFRLSTTVNLLGLDFETFFGGNDNSWATPKDQYAYFTNLNLSYQ